MNIRLCNPSDEKKWIDINREFMLFEISDSSLWNDTEKVNDAIFQETFREALANPSLITLLIFEEDDEIIGFANLPTVYSVWAHGKAILIDDLFIKEKYRGKGFGKIAMEYIENYARENDIKRIQFQSKPSNKESKKFYNALGFTSVDMYYYIYNLW